MLGVAAAVVSLVSLWLALHSAHSMEKLVASNSYPYVELMRSMATEAPVAGTEHYKRRVKYMLENNGVGPARIEWVEFRFKGQPVRDITDLMEKCCGFDPAQLRDVDPRGGIAGSLVRPGAEVHLFTWTEPATPNASFDALHRQMKDISYSACYCSVFDDCYLTSSGQGSKPSAVEQCIPPAVPFRPGFSSR